MSGSPPENVTPPPDSSKKTRSRTSSLITSATVIVLPAIVLTPARQTPSHRPHAVHASVAPGTPPTRTAAPVGHTVRQSPHPVHRSTVIISSGWRPWLSGLWHHWHASGQPLRNTTVRIPGPSCTA